MSRDKRDAEQAARRAKRLAERAEERARRKERHAERAAERAERLAERVKRRPGREKELDQSIEDLVDEVTEKAEAWIDEQTRRLFESPAEEKEIKRAEGQARRAKEEADKARENARRAEKAAEDLSNIEAALEDDVYAESYDDDLDSSSEFRPRSRREQRRARRRAKKRSRQDRHWYADWGGMDWGYDSWGFDHPRRRRDRKRRPRSAHLYRDRERKKILGVCAGTADYLGRPVWEIRMYAILGLIFIPSVMFPTYFITYFFMDDKPYYRRVTDRFDESMDRDSGEGDDTRGKSGARASAQDNDMKQHADSEPRPNNVQAMKEARSKFSDIEQRLRQMETHVTSSRFELQRELKKISGED